MTEEIRIWQIKNDSKLIELVRSRLNLEERLENWIENDVSILADNLLVIGRQIDTDFGGVIDILCLDRTGNLVIVELKRDKTPREVTAQVLDYASWVQELSNDQITKIAEKYLGSRGPLEKAFREKFSETFPEILNENHSMLIVASDIDPSSERIIKYLSDNYGVNINAITFQYFQKDEGDEFLARVFLLEPSQVEYKSQIRKGSKRLPNLTLEELQEISDDNGVGELFQRFVEGLYPYLDKYPTRSSLAFYGKLDRGRRACFSLLPPVSNAESGLKFQIYYWRMAELFKVDESSIDRLLPENYEPWQYSEGSDEDMSGFEGYFKQMEEVTRFLDGLKTLSKK